MTPRSFGFLAALALAGCGAEPPLATVSDFDVQRYLGTWHEIAAIPAWFQRNCASDTTAVYTPAPEPGEIAVTNSCRTAVVSLAQLRWNQAGMAAISCQVPR